jgi:hypothetical protein
MNNFYKIVKKNIIKISTVILFFVLSSNSACEDQNNRHDNGRGRGFGFESAKFYQNTK